MINNTRQLEKMKTSLLSVCFCLFLFTIKAQTFDFSLSFIGTNPTTGNYEVALLATPDFTETNGNSADMGVVVSMSTNIFLQPGSTGFVNDCITLPPPVLETFCEYPIEKEEWSATYLTDPSTTSGRYVYQLLRTETGEATFLDAVAGEPIILAVFQIYNTVSGLPDSGDITLVENDNAILDGTPNLSYMNIRYDAATGGVTSNLYSAHDPSANSLTFPLATTGDLIISEIMQNPNDVSDINGEYFEIYNDETEPINLNGWTITDGGTDTHTITSDLIIEGDSFMVLGINSDYATNGGVIVNYQYSSIALDNSSDEIILTDAFSTEIDRVEYDGGTSWPNPDGAAMIYIGSNIENNNDGSLWQAATIAEGISPDLGSPGSNGTDQIVDWLVYDTSAWNKTPSASTSEKNALIRASETLTFGSDISLLSLVVEPDADVTVSSSVTLSIDDIILESTSTDYASLISDGTLSGTTVTYKRHVNQTAASGGNDLVASPVSGETFDDFLAANDNIVSNATNTLYLFGPFDKTSGTYITYASTATDALTSGVGYRAATTDNGTLDFSGSITQSDVDIAITNSGPHPYSQWNLIGNPYPSYINVQAFLSDVTNAALLDENNVGIYGYDGDASDGWIIYNMNTTSLTSVITPGQGFFVGAESDGTLNFKTSMRSHGTSDDFIAGRSADDNQHVRLQLSNTSAQAYTDLYFNDNSSYGLDPGYDAGVFGDVAGAFSIYSRLVTDDQGIDFAIQSLPQDVLSNDVLIPLGINANAGEPLTVSIANLNQLQGSEVYLLDNQTQEVTPLNTEDFSITPIEDLNGTGRFYLGLSNSTLTMDDSELDGLKVFTQEKYILIKGQLLEDTNFRLYDLQGRLVMESLLEASMTRQSINASMYNDGVYIIELHNGNERKTYKIILN